MLNNSTSAFSSDEMMSTMREMSAKMQSTPNVFVTTPKSLILLLKAVKEQEQKHFDGEPPREYLGALAGIRVEECATVRDCLDRMMEPRKGERLKLILSEDIPVDCLDHPWIKQQVSETLDRMGLGWMQVK